MSRHSRTYARAHTAYLPNRNLYLSSLSCDSKHISTVPLITREYQRDRAICHLYVPSNINSGSDVDFSYIIITIIRFGFGSPINFFKIVFDNNGFKQN